MLFEKCRTTRNRKISTTRTQQIKYFNFQSKVQLDPVLQLYQKRLGFGTPSLLNLHPDSREWRQIIVLVRAAGRRHRNFVVNALAPNSQLAYQNCTVLS